MELLLNKPGKKIEYKSKKRPPIIAVNQAQEEKPVRNKTITKTKTKDNCLGNKDQDICKVTSKKIKKSNPINLTIENIK